ncbi:GNAT family N-acetyltransferase [Nocardia terpenica]|uniref:GNAT family N-acetyltransferase n=1 Tax=Nocardia terpenica TaxID=455432 RepID=A0A6G9ZDU5_9NOCA|nr:GNAT family N-acetyltransferase [Nocardia terpenica]QIS23286.1 GNAT family N-acetyltransferase [Nocardia terpenica]
MSVSIDSDVPGLVARHVRAAVTQRAHERIGPFLAAFDSHSANPWRNYAVPDDGAQPGTDDVAALVTVFERRGRVPRLEYVPAAAPQVEAALHAAGFTVEGRPPVMVSVPGSLPIAQLPSGVVMQLATSDDELLAAATVQHLAYREPEPPGPNDVARLRSCARRGGLIALAIDTATSRTVGSGLVEPIEGVGELAAVGVLESFRRRGIATAMSLYLAAAAHEHGVRMVWLEAAPDEEHIYLRAGFTPAGRKLWISRP